MKHITKIIFNSYKQHNIKHPESHKIMYIYKQRSGLEANTKISEIKLKETIYIMNK